MKLIFEEKILELCKWLSKTTLYKDILSRENYDNYSKDRNKCTIIIRQAKRAYEKRILENFKQNPKGFWGYIQDQTRFRKGVHDFKNEHGETVTTNQDKANLLNSVFCQSVFNRTRWTYTATRF